MPAMGSQIIVKYNYPYIIKISPAMEAVISFSMHAPKRLMCSFPKCVIFILCGKLSIIVWPATTTANTKKSPSLDKASTTTPSPAHTAISMDAFDDRESQRSSTLTSGNPVGYDEVESML